VVVADSRRAASGKFIERLGFYDPESVSRPRGAAREHGAREALDRRGAQLSPTAKRLVKRLQKTA
jgi:small subunit ribosomal protein S16